MAFTALLLVNGFSGGQQVMRDVALDIFLMVFFGMAGMAVLILAWMQPMPVSERILSTSVGSIGLLVALIRTLMFKSMRTRTCAATVPVEARVEDT